MVLTFTNVLSVSHVGEADVRAMLIGFLGCNLAWGIIDGVMYLMNSLAARGRELDALRAIRAANDPDEAQRMVAAQLPEGFAAVLYPGELEPFFRRLRALPEPSARPRLTGVDWLGAFGIFGLVFFSTCPMGTDLPGSVVKRRSICGYYARRICGTGRSCLCHARRVAATGWHLWLPARRARLRFIWRLPPSCDWADFRDLAYGWGFRRAPSHGRSGALCSDCNSCGICSGRYVRRRLALATEHPNQLHQ